MIRETLENPSHLRDDGPVINRLGLLLHATHAEGSQDRGVYWLSKRHFPGQRLLRPID
jgi:hypothetical protein